MSVEAKFHRWVIVVSGLCVFLAGAAVSLAAAAAEPEATKDAPANGGTADDVLRFLDGATMHGAIHGMDPGRGLRWQHRDAKKPFELQPAHLDSLHFAHPMSLTNSPDCYFRFFSGDEIYGSLVSLSADAMVVNTWFGSTLKIPRSAIQTISFLPKNYSLLYEGPTDASGWLVSEQQRNGVIVRGRGNAIVMLGVVQGPAMIQGNWVDDNPNRQVGTSTSNSWVYHDGSFVSTSVGTLARDFHLSGSSSIDFDVECKGTLNLLVQSYATALDRLQYNDGAFLLDLDDNPDGFAGNRTTGLPLDLGTVLLPDFRKLGKAHITIHYNDAEGTVALLVDGVPTKQWTGIRLPHDNGGGLLFQSQTLDSIKLSGIRISEWGGGFEPDLTARATTNIDNVSFVNNDKATGQIGDISENKLQLNVSGNSLAIPLDRVRQINFTQSGPPPAQPGDPWVVRAYFAGGGNVSFQMDKWNTAAVSGHSPLFGPVAFPPESIREMEFNLDRPPNAPAPQLQNEFDVLDQ